jgi:hypothetical protein
LTRRRRQWWDDKKNHKKLGRNYNFLLLLGVSALRRSTGAVDPAPEMREVAMRADRKFRLNSILTIALVLGALLSACGTDSPTGKTTETVGSVVTTTTPTAGLKSCTSCHATTTSDWMLTKHANVEPVGNLYSTGIPTLGQITTCTKNCHDANGDGANPVNQFVSSVTGTPRPVVSCESCHGGGSLHVAAGGAGLIGNVTTTAMVIGTTSTLPVSAQYRTCTGCHELLDPADPASATTPATAAHVSVPPTGNNYIITDTHFAKPGSFPSPTFQNVLDVSGYVMNYASESVCTDCHNPHTTADINREWAQSRHADKRALFAWAHYNWSCDNTSGCFANPAMPFLGSRTVCQRCHTTTGYAAYAAALQAGDSASANAIHNGSAPPVTPFNPNFKPEMLECKGCHMDNKGAVRSPGAYNASYKVPAGGFPTVSPLNANVSYQYPDISTSNLCMPCHTGMSSGKALHALNTGTTKTVNFGNQGYIDGHYLTAGGTIFKGTAYEYPGRSYSNPASYKHGDIGTPLAPNTGTNGPCVGCHMDRPDSFANHRFLPVGKDASGNITSVSSPVCFICHAASATEFALIVEEEKKAFDFAISALQGRLAAKGYTFLGYYPYFPTTNWLSAGDTDTTGNTSGKNNMGSAFNFNLLRMEPGGFVHNSKYVKRIIYDAIDWLDDNAMNYSSGLTLQSNPTPTNAAAMKYLLSQPSYDAGGTIIPGIPAERP